MIVNRKIHKCQKKDEMRYIILPGITKSNSNGSVLSKLRERFPAEQVWETQQITASGGYDMTGGRRIRTDLALETTERFAQENTEIRGVEIQEDYDEEKDIRTTVVKIVTENGAKSMGRPQGTYITIEAPDLSNADED